MDWKIILQHHLVNDLPSNPSLRKLRAPPPKIHEAIRLLTPPWYRSEGGRILNESLAESHVFRQAYLGSDRTGTGLMRHL